LEPRVSRFEVLGIGSNIKTLPGIDYKVRKTVYLPTEASAEWLEDSFGKI
jgi:hypothetical protein